jgi:hypothetical protein
MCLPDGFFRILRVKALQEIKTGRHGQWADSNNFHKSII